MKISMHIILYVHTVWLQTHPCLKGNLREAYIFLASVASAPHSLAGFARAV